LLGTALLALPCSAAPAGAQTPPAPSATMHPAPARRAVEGFGPYRKLV